MSWTSHHPPFCFIHEGRPKAGAELAMTDGDDLLSALLAADQFDTASGVDQGWNIGKIRQHRKFEDLGDAILKQQQAGDKTKQAERRRLVLGEHLVHVVSPCLTRQA